MAEVKISALSALNTMTDAAVMPVVEGGATKKITGTNLKSYFSPPAVHGCFHKMANVTAAAADTVYNFDWFTDVTQHVGDQGVTVTSGQPTRVNISTAGDYMVNLEMIIKITGNAERNVFLWLAKNGNDIAETGVKISLRQGGVNAVYQTIAKPWLLDDINANDYIELRFAVSREDGISLEFTAAQTSPYIRPAIPSAVITVAQI
jgi:hypothetical protein